MKIERATSDITAIKRGSTDVNYVYRSTTLIWQKSQLPLDIVSADRAYSLRKLKTSATASIKIRRSSDNADLDIGFVGNDIDETAISNFCGASNGTIRLWYDQSGNNANANVQNTNFTHKVYDAISGIIKRNGKIAASSGVNSAYVFTTLTNVQSAFFVAEYQGNPNPTQLLNYIVFSSVSPPFGLHIFTNYSNFAKFGFATNQSTNTGGNEFGTGINPGLSGQNLGTFFYSATASKYMMSRNGSADTFGNVFGGSANANTKFALCTVNQIGRVTDISLGNTGFLQEIIIGASGSSTINMSNKATITSDINSYWNVY